MLKFKDHDPLEKKSIRKEVVTALIVVFFFLLVFRVFCGVFVIQPIGAIRILYLWSIGGREYGK